jgi:threonine dehydrogenase-like Zn-dependent dehydrogenase
MAEYLLAEEKDLVLLPEGLSYSDGAQVACGFGTVYEGLEKIGINGNDDVLITGLGPVGLASAMLCRALGAKKIYGVEVIDERIAIAKNMGLFDEIVKAGENNVEQIRALTSGYGVEKSVDCSANNKARLTCIQATRKWGKIVFLGEGGTVEFQPSRDIIHDQKTIYGSWVTNIWRMEELVERLVRWGIKPESLITHRFKLSDVSQAYSLMASGKCGKVAVVFDEETHMLK